MLNNNEIEVIEAVTDRVEIKVGNIHLVFQSNGKKMGLVSKFDPLREIYDANAIWVPKKFFTKASKQAAQIMKDKRLLAAKKDATTN
ncbi:MAG: hypothetical protein CO001_02635 [Candidatus Portnoybacteria bacterium CG_4_8_14_3_um_filter_40_10]|uniref:Uncharacterized protein n=4 Tax=Candidatus Portnoyibacteriota TaxID=1817913 RepID=A0A2M7II74_9BACT|nr:MAG: hypothetical protein COV84_01455 [Candidatus Portnoybacteria bacterium CG11_big_fil_rev_8_21_14_0_20_40_15]PIS31975.1 MAG: hypothetical protein COT41_00115 [Candidatus Portnoybacteria bacterium CG08_land_8_20_14_0_20_40_83]PIW76214.1 MAG: hypothetical protein CO001_02635 [Candidatus Portnoybacteria bacterium CG_4_8_14_3_um_filter_40_10]PIY74303.1 MAG: hypothetical protein COY85_03670 [Candidatus Portnoybacteria bacterium CG_4_10_14_0_8_um_filter_40_50]PJA64532.1 MAG: hypothetical protei